MSVPYYGDIAEDATISIPFNTFTSNDPSASSTITNLVAGDIKIHKGSSTDEKASADGVAVAINFDSVTGNHLVTIDTSNDTGASGFWATGNDFFVRMEGTTIDGATVNAWIGSFSIENRTTTGTASAASIADAVWEEVGSDHNTPGTTGAKQNRSDRTDR